MDSTRVRLIQVVVIIWKRIYIRSDAKSRSISFQLGACIWNQPTLQSLHNSTNHAGHESAADWQGQLWPQSWKLLCQSNRRWRPWSRFWQYGCLQLYCITDCAALSDTNEPSEATRSPGHRHRYETDQGPASRVREVLDPKKESNLQEV